MNVPILPNYTFTEVKNGKFYVYFTQKINRLHNVALHTSWFRNTGENALCMPYLSSP